MTSIGLFALPRAVEGWCPASQIHPTVGAVLADGPRSWRNREQAPRPSPGITGAPLFGYTLRRQSHGGARGASERWCGPFFFGPIFQLATSPLGTLVGSSGIFDAASNVSDGSFSSLGPSGRGRWRPCHSLWFRTSSQMRPIGEVTLTGDGCQWWNRSLDARLGRLTRRYRDYESSQVKARLATRGYRGDTSGGRICRSLRLFGYGGWCPTPQMHPSFEAFREEGGCSRRNRGQVAQPPSRSAHAMGTDNAVISIFLAVSDRLRLAHCLHRCAAGNLVSLHTCVLARSRAPHALVHVLARVRRPALVAAWGGVSLAVLNLMALYVTPAAHIENAHVFRGGTDRLWLRYFGKVCWTAIASLGLRRTTPVRSPSRYRRGPSCTPFGLDAADPLFSPRGAVKPCPSDDSHGDRACRSGELVGGDHGRIDIDFTGLACLWGALVRGCAALLCRTASLREPSCTRRRWFDAIRNAGAAYWERLLAAARPRLRREVLLIERAGIVGRRRVRSIRLPSHLRRLRSRDGSVNGADAYFIRLDTAPIRPDDFGLYGGASMG